MVFGSLITGDKTLDRFYELNNSENGVWALKLTKGPVLLNEN